MHACVRIHVGKKANQNEKEQLYLKHLQTEMYKLKRLFKDSLQTRPTKSVKITPCYQSTTQFYC